MGASIRPKSVSRKGKACIGLEGVQTDPDRSCSPLEVLYNWHTLQLIWRHFSYSFQSPARESGKRANKSRLRVLFLIIEENISCSEEDR